jgi:hypothetical protein
MSPTIDSSIEGLASIYKSNKEQIVAAGARYTPGIDPDAPNLSINPIVDSLHALSFSEDMKTTVCGFARDIGAEWANRNDSRTLFPDVSSDPGALAACLKKLAEATPDGISSLISEIAKTTSSILAILNKEREALFEQEKATEANSEERRIAEGQVHSIRKFQAVLNPLEEYIQSPSFQALSKNILLIKGEWGTGKTHLLCDITNTKMSNGLPVLFLLSHRLPRVGWSVIPS